MNNNLGVPLVLAGLTLAADANAQETMNEIQQQEIENILVTGSAFEPYDFESTTPMQTLSGAELNHRRQGTLGETLNGLPGIHLDSFGGGASRPVIRGQTLPRIEVLTDGARLFDAASVSPDHAITTDPLLLDKIEIIRGSAATIYGGNAMNGAINLIDSKIPKSVPEKTATGSAEVRLGSGDNEKAYSGRVTAGTGSFAVHAEGSFRKSDDYSVPIEYGTDKLQDSFAENSSYSVGASWITNSGYIGAAYTKQQSEYGLPGHSHANAPCHTHDTDLHCEVHGGYTDPFAGSDDSHTAYIDLSSERVDIRADYKDLLPGIDHTRLRLSYTDYVHDEIDGPFLFSRYTNEVYDGRLELTHAPLLGFTGTFGVQYTDEIFSGLNFNSAHKSDYVYDFKTENVGVFLTERRAFGAVDVTASVRQDWRTMGAVKKHWSEYYVFPPGYNLTPELEELYKGFYDEDFENNYPSSKHNPLSASIGVTWNIDEQYSLGLTLARSQRAPSVRELYAKGNNLATNSYEVGLARTAVVSDTFPAPSTEVEETAKSVDLTFIKTSGKTEFEVGLFYQDIDDYIFARLIEEDLDLGHRFLLYTAANARFSGIDGQISHQFTPESRVTVFGDYVDSKLKNEDDNLPRIPPGRLGARYDWSRGPLTANAEYYHTFEQDNVASYESPTGGYNMINATISYNFNLGLKQATEMYLRGTNLTDELAYVHTSFVKDQSPLRGRNFALGLRQQF